MHLCASIPHGCKESCIAAVHNWRAEPLKGHGIPLLHELQGLAQLPASHIQLASDGLFNDIASVTHLQVPGQAMHIDEAHIIVAVRG